MNVLKKCKCGGNVYLLTKTEKHLVCILCNKKIKLYKGQTK